MGEQLNTAHANIDDANRLIRTFVKPQTLVA